MFDIVIGNPPYIGEKCKRDLFLRYKNSHLRDFYQGRIDIFYLFFHQAIDLVNEEGVICFLTTNYYITATYGNKLRADIKNRTVIRRLINFNETKIFSGLNLHCLITLLIKTNKNMLCCLNTIEDIRVLDNVFISGCYVSQRDLFVSDKNYICIVEDNRVRLILDKISRNTRLIDICNVNQGIVTGADRVNKRYIDKYGVKANIGDGIFVLNYEELKKLRLNAVEQRLIKKLYKNSNINKWVVDLKTDKYLIYLTDDVDWDNIPNIVKHLNRFIDILRARREVKTNVGCCFSLIENRDRDCYGLWRSRERSIFELSKIVVPQRSLRNRFAYNESEFFATSDVYFITLRSNEVSLKYLLGLLNSELYYYWFYYRGKRKGEFLELYQVPLSETPIYVDKSITQSCVIDLVNKILDIVNQDDYLKDDIKIDMVKYWEQQLNDYIYSLYGLDKKDVLSLRRKNV